MQRVLLELSPETYQELLAHLLPPDGDSEQVAFVFARAEPERGDLVFRFADWLPVGPEGLVYSSSYYLELTDETRARVIKTAHDLGASLVEFHSHLGPWPAAFSASDRAGFLEFVPHVWWRLRGLPYAAVVVAARGFDALAWVDDPHTPRGVDGIRTGGRLLRPTGLTLGQWSNDDER